VLKFGRASMQATHETVLRRLEHEYRIVLRIEFVDEAQRVAPARGCARCCDVRVDLFGDASGGRAATRRWYCTHCLEVQHSV
jgi:hypothetical protein